MAARVTAPEAGDVRSGRWLGLSSPPLPLNGEDRLARLAGDGNERAFAVLYERHYQPLYRYCRSLVRNDADAQDALQSTFTAALAALRRGQRDAPLRPWLFRIAHNESISLLRRRRPDAALSEATESTVPSAEHSAEDRARLAALVGDLSQLPERQRGALLMRELSGLSHDQIAQAFGISLGAAKQTVFEARRSLAEFAEGRAMACDEIQRVISDGDGRARRARRVRAHLRDCSRCAAFATAISGREADLRALSPALPVAAASGILARLTGLGSGHGSGASGVAASATGKAATTVMSLKAATAGVALVTAAAAGTAGVLHNFPTHHARSSERRPADATPGHAPGTSQPRAPGVAPARGGAQVGPARSHSARLTTAGATGAAGALGGHSRGTGNRGATGNHGSASSGSAGKHLGATKGPDAGKHLGATKDPGAAKHLGATKSASAGKHLGTSKRASSGKQLGAATHTGAGAGHSGATHDQGSSSQPQKPVASKTPTATPSSSNNGSGSKPTALTQTKTPTSSSGSSTATPSTATPGPPADTKPQR
jgi:RNA polymerase sigma factor (sigma-70 family)